MTGSSLKSRAVRMLATLVAALLSCSWASDAYAGCAARSTAAYDIGTWTSGQAAGGVVRTYEALAGVSCSGPVLTLIGTNSIIAKVHSGNGFRLVSTDGMSVSYVASVTKDGSMPIAQDGEVDYADRRILNLLGLFGSSSADLPIHFLSFKGSRLPTGTYTDVVTVAWRWRVCDGVNVAGLLCVLYQEGTGTTTISITMRIENRDPQVTITASTVFDPVNGKSAPKSIPGAYTVHTVKVVNPDVVPLDPSGVVLTLPVDRRLKPTADSSNGQANLVEIDGSSAQGVGIRSVEGSTDGSSWAPTVSQDATLIRIAADGPIPPGSTFAIRIGYQVR